MRPSTCTLRILPLLMAVATSLNAQTDTYDRDFLTKTIDSAFSLGSISPIVSAYNAYSPDGASYSKEAIIMASITAALSKHKYDLIDKLLEWNRRDLGNRPEFKYMMNTGFYDGEPPSHSYYSYVANLQDYDALRFLLSRHFAFDIPKSNYGRDDWGLWGYDFIYILDEKHSIDFLKPMVEAGYDIDATGPARIRNDGYRWHQIRYNFLCQAISTENYDIAELLIDRGARVNIPNIAELDETVEARTALDLAIEKGKDSLVEHLRNRGAKAMKELAESPPAEIFVEAPQMIVTDDSVRLRKKPSLTGEIVGKLNTGEQIRVAEMTDEKTTVDGKEYPWYLIKSQSGRVGWVYGAFVRPGMTLIDK